MILNAAATNAAAVAPIVFHQPSLGDIVAIVVALFGLLLSAFNSGSELAYFSLKSADVEEIDDEDARERVEALLRKPNKLLATILIGNNLVNVMLVILLNYALSHIMQFNSAVLDFIVQTVLLTFLILLFGEVIPKLYAQSHNREFAVIVSGPLQLVVKLFSPLSSLLVKSTAIVKRVVHTGDDDVSREDLATALEASDMDAGGDKKMLESILSFGDKTVSEIMRPRMDVVDLDYEDKFDTVVRRVVDTGYSRLPVFDETPDNIKGILYAKDLLPYIGKRDNNFRWQNLMRPAYFVPETRSLDDVLEDFRTRKMHMAIIVDEYGCTQGIVTLEDVLEEIVGEIDDEYDTEQKFYTRIGTDTFIFDGNTPLTDFCRVTEVEDDALGDAAEEAETLAGLMLSLKGDFLSEGEELEAGPFKLTVMKVIKYRIDKIKVTRNHLDDNKVNKDNQKQ